MTITVSALDALEVLDSRGHPTVQALLTLSDGRMTRAAVPSGASTGANEALELRDGDPARYRGKGVMKAVHHVRGPLAQAVVGLDPRDQKQLDERLIAADGTPDKSRLGANALLAVSMASALAAAQLEGQPLWRYLNGLSVQAGLVAAPRLPLPMINLFSGGKHAGGQVDFQDFLIVPRGARTLAQALEMTHGVYYTALDLLQKEHGYQPLVADEGGLAPQLASNEALLELAVRAIEGAGYRPLEDVALAIDVASSHFHREGRYTLAVEGRALSAAEMIERLRDWCDRYPVVSIEDGLAEEDWTNWPKLCSVLGSRCQVLGDDFLVTNPARIERAVKAQAANSVLVKVNQIGTLSEALKAMRVAVQAGWTTVVSARSGETEDSWLADLAVGTGGGQIKVGAITRSERLAKYNRLLAIAHHSPALPFARDELDRFIVN
ncbi:MAG: phosphopyruvate hydratase [Deltaproteobacteria bacterium]|nr:phosphopyruvate hydratase [Deltaproteobacteria bacterium]